MIMHQLTINSSDDADGGTALGALSVTRELIDDLVLGHNTDGGAALAALEVGRDLLYGSGGLGLADGGGDGREGSKCGEHCEVG
jgi:hypothetical protein